MVAELARQLVGIARYDETRVVGVDDLATRYSTVPLGFSLGLIRSPRNDLFGIFAVVEVECGRVLAVAVSAGQQFVK